MFIATLTLSIHPGGTPDTKAWLQDAQAQLPAGLQARRLTLNVEIGEVNTLVVLFALNDPVADLCTLREGLNAARLATPNPHPVTFTLELMQADDTVWPLLDSVGRDHAPVLLQITHRQPSTVSDLQAVLSPVTGVLDAWWCLTRLASTDEALILSEAVLQDDACGLLRSCLLDPVR
ncbi:hypothetical protein [Neopusillimonas aromaticivorans]|uniref:hypothetical protein n=1 Tax=Neopusillimonas aromaticivorans TaxID=2979868 RepID=UPI0025933EA6|nr:hypothetical protein [Neopusillimonas aromaticivorans]WJJ94895.1 hypothetical protein N7E01_08630 [Neopusillimonas aromaticivorans]